MTVQIKVKKTHPRAIVPKYMSEHAAGMDVCTVIESPVVLDPGQRYLFPTGLVMEIPPGFEGQVRPRSGLALRHGLSLPNSPGTIDADYRGEIGIIVINLGQDPVTIHPGDRIAQLVITPVSRAELIEVESLTDTVRDAGGFGHTGVNHDNSI